MARSATRDSPHGRVSLKVRISITLCAALGAATSFLLPAMVIYWFRPKGAHLFLVAILFVAAACFATGGATTTFILSRRLLCPARRITCFGTLLVAAILTYASWLLVAMALTLLGGPVVVLTITYVAAMASPAVAVVMYGSVAVVCRLATNSVPTPAIESRVRDIRMGAAILWNLASPVAAVFAGLLVSERGEPRDDSQRIEEFLLGLMLTYLLCQLVGLLIAEWPFLAAKPIVLDSPGACAEPKTSLALRPPLRRSGRAHGSLNDLVEAMAGLGVVAALGLLTASLAVDGAMSLPIRDAEPAPKRYVNDRAGVLSSAQREALDRRLTEFESVTNNVMVIDLYEHVPAPSLEKVTRDGASDWTKTDVVLFMFREAGTVRLQVSRKLATVVTDAKAMEIVDRMEPRLREEDYAGALDIGVSGVVEALQRPGTSNSMR
jgi:hypothetical protein